MNIIERVQHASIKTRMAIAIAVLVLCMLAVGYVWYESFTSSLVGSFEIEESSRNRAADAPLGEPHEESFFGSLKSLVSDIDFGAERFSEFGATFINIFSN